MNSIKPLKFILRKVYLSIVGVDESPHSAPRVDVQSADDVLDENLSLVVPGWINGSRRIESKYDVLVMCTPCTNNEIQCDHPVRRTKNNVYTLYNEQNTMCASFPLNNKYWHLHFFPIASELVSAGDETT